MTETNWTRVEAWGAWAAVLIVIFTGMLTTWGMIQRIEQRMDDSDAARVAMQQSLDRIEQRLYTIGK